MKQLLGVSAENLGEEQLKMLDASVTEFIGKIVQITGGVSPQPLSVRASRKP